MHRDRVQLRGTVVAGPAIGAQERIVGHPRHQVLVEMEHCVDVKRRARADPDESIRRCAPKLEARADTTTPTTLF